MILGVGIDIVLVSRVERAIKNPRFVERCYSKKEREWLFSKKNYARSAAMNFAAKEAFSKSLGTGIRGFGLHEVEVLRGANGKPYIQLYGKAKQVAESLGATNFLVSLSDSKENAIACVIAEGEKA